MNSAQASIGAEHLTVHGAENLTWGPPAIPFHLTNSILCQVVNLGVLNIVKTEVQTVIPSVFKVAGRGSHYLPEESSLRNSGTTLISPEMAAILRSTTTAPP